MTTAPRGAPCSEQHGTHRALFPTQRSLYVQRGRTLAWSSEVSPNRTPPVTHAHAARHIRRRTMFVSRDVFRDEEDDDELPPGGRDGTLRRPQAATRFVFCPAPAGRPARARAVAAPVRRAWRRRPRRHAHAYLGGCCGFVPIARCGSGGEPGPEGRLRPLGPAPRPSPPIRRAACHVVAPHCASPPRRLFPKMHSMHGAQDRAPFAKRVAAWRELAHGTASSSANSDGDAGASP